MIASTAICCVHEILFGDLSPLMCSIILCLQNAKKFVEMLAEKSSLSAHSRWSDVKAQFASDSRYRGVHHSKQREQLFYEHTASLAHVRLCLSLFSLLVLFLSLLHCSGFVFLWLSYLTYISTRRETCQVQVLE